MREKQKNAVLLLVKKKVLTLFYARRVRETLIRLQT